MDWLVEMLAKIGMEPGTWGSAIGQGAIVGAGTGGLGSLLTGQNVGQGMAQGALLGGVGGAGAKGLGMLASPEVIAAQDAKNAELLAKAKGVSALPTAPQSQGLTTYGQPDIANIRPFQGELTGGSTAPIARPIQTFDPVAPVTSDMPSMAKDALAASSSGQAPKPSFLNKVGNFAMENPGLTSGIIGLGAGTALNAATADNQQPQNQPYTGPLSKFKWSGGTPNYDPLKYKPYLPYGYAAGGITDLDGYMSQAQNIPTNGIAQIPNPAEVADPEGYGQESMRMMAQGGVADLGGYAAGGRPNLLHGAGDGVSDSIPATIAGKQPARLASGEYVISSRIVSELGNGSTDAGAQRLDDMVKRIQAGRSKTMGKNKEYAKDTKPYKHLPA